MIPKSNCSLKLKNMAKIVNPPKMQLNPEQQSILRNFKKEVNNWKRFLTGAGFKVMTMDAYTSAEDSPLSCFVYGRGSAFWSGWCLEDARKKNLIMLAAGFAAPQQFSANRYWPDFFGDETPPFIEIAFFPGKAKITCYGKGNSCFECILKELPEDYWDTWKQVANKLLKIQKGIAESLRAEIPT
jgi:hypothetical protein